MSITGQQLQDKFKSDPMRTSHALAETLREFGYPNLTDKEVQDITQRLVDGETMNTNIVAMFINGWLINGID